MVAPLAAASSVAPFWTACQNWCCDPLETMAMYGVLAPPDEAAGDAPPSPQAAKTMAIAMRAPAGRIARVSFMLLLRGWL